MKRRYLRSRTSWLARKGVVWRISPVAWDARNRLELAGDTAFQRTSKKPLWHSNKVSRSDRDRLGQGICLPQILSSVPDKDSGLTRPIGKATGCAGGSQHVESDVIW